MATFNNDGEKSTLLIFNHKVERFNILKEIVTKHGSHFQNKMMTELMSNLGFKKEHSSPYYLQVNGQVEVVNRSLKTILQRTINSAKSNWHLMLHSTLWAYQIFVKNTTGFSHFQLIYGLEAILPIECHIPSLKLAVGLFLDTSLLEECVLYIKHLDEKHCDAASTNEAHNKWVKFQYDRSIHHHIFSEADLFMVYDQDKDPLGGRQVQTHVV
jgi:hypothetical protein